MSWRMFAVPAAMVVSLLLASCGGQAENPQARAPVAPPEDIKLEASTPLSAYRKPLVEDAVVTPRIRGAVEVPFVVLRAGKAAATVELDIAANQSTLRMDNGQRIPLARPGVPVVLLDLGEARTGAIVRSLPDSELWLADWTNAAKGMRFTKVKRPGVEFLMFRAALFHEGVLNLVLYDNHAAKNYLRRLRLEGNQWVAAGPELELPTMEDPAGTHYEMEPPVFLFGEKDGLRILAGTLNAKAGAEWIEVKRIEDCAKVLEAIATPTGVGILCNRKNVDTLGAYTVVHPAGEPPEVLPLSQGIPWKLSWDEAAARLAWRKATDTQSYGEMMEHDIQRGQNGGMLELGSNNIEGRIAWSQIYYLNGFMDAVHLARREQQAFDVFYPLLEKLRLRIELEVRLIDRQLGAPEGLRTRAFTKDRSLALFGVQTSRALLLLTRYLEEFPGAPPLANLGKFEREVKALQGHIEVMANAGEAEKWLAPGTRHLRWPKGSAFYYDGMPVPYNHQNEWAYGVLDAHRAAGGKTDDPAVEAQREIIRHFISRLGKDGRFPEPLAWDYWWGHAYDGYDEASARSLNTPSYVGDKSAAWISFRTIDLMSVLGARGYVAEAGGEGFAVSARDLIMRGEVYPFAARSLDMDGARAGYHSTVAHKYARSGAPWEIANVPWALATLPAGKEAEDPHSYRLNEKVVGRLPSIASAGADRRQADQLLLDYLAIALPYNASMATREAGRELGGKYVAWNLAYDMRAAVLAYERTKDGRFLALFERAADRLIAMRDDRLGVVDDLRGRPAKSWGSNRYSANKQKWVAWDAFAGMAVYPLVKYCVVARGMPSAARLCAQYRKVAEEALAEYGPYWRDDEASGGGFYVDPYLEDIAPLNHMLTLGLVHIELQKLGASGHKDRAIKLARFFRHHWKDRNNGSVEWEYWAGAQQAKHKSATAEDVTHAQINVHFAYESYKVGNVITKDDMAKLAKTLLLNVRKNQGDWAADLAGGGQIIGSGLHEGLTGWVILDEFDGGVARLIARFVMEHPAAFPLGNFSYATGPIAMAYGLPGLLKRAP
ncbi:hypothetical protein [Accumulibacter sp.]|jgi:hypothetical protein|uniref:Uncharacterized protein n=1 Tax=Accumulibacter regalis TaxID=522306 RepID=C7RIW1_ACCRE|nr:hypothetical protein [Accumulibacter sp.]MBN8499398.1 hypothetical protein [Accumulibacter sp.]MBO3713495.1 hypothetical protein [Accumulibacter sp.]